MLQRSWAPENRLFTSDGWHLHRHLYPQPTRIFRIGFSIYICVNLRGPYQEANFGDHTNEILIAKMGKWLKKLVWTYFTY